MKRITLVQVGVGTIGGAVIEQVLDHRDGWRQALSLDVVIGAVVGRGGALVGNGPDGLPDEVLRGVVADRRQGAMVGQGAPADAELQAPTEALARLAATGPTIVVDAAAGDLTAGLDARALELGAGVALANKAPLALPWADPLSRTLWGAAGPRGRLRYEASCGAGLPNIAALRSLLDAGDEVIEIHGALSGTLGAIFSDLAAGHPFSAAVRAAMERGYTEPDPRDDLSGLDVARKALILARTIGRPVDLDEIAVESLVPAHLQDRAAVDVEAFLAQVAGLDPEMAERGERAREAGAALKYVATVTPEGPLAVGVRAIPTDTVLGALQGPENIVSIRTRRYDAYPLVITGPGAGPAVTATMLLADMLALADIVSRG